MIIDVPNSGSRWRSVRWRVSRTRSFWCRARRHRTSTGPKCNANTIHWTYDTWNLANGTGKAMVKTGGDTWFFMTADMPSGWRLSATPLRW